MGLYGWGSDSFTKQIYDNPTRALTIDWVHSFRNVSNNSILQMHYAEPQHSTDAITQAAEHMMRNHTRNFPKKPLFLYVAYTAAHNPLQVFNIVLILVFTQTTRNTA